MGSFVRFKLVRERTHVSGTFSRFANSFESITSVSFNCIGVASLRFRLNSRVVRKQMEWARVEPEMGMDKGTTGQGKGVRPVGQRCAGPTARHHALQVCSLW